MEQNKQSILTKKRRTKKTKAAADETTIGKGLQEMPKDIELSRV